MRTGTSTDQLNRRQFLRGAGTVALTLGFVALNAADGARAGSKEISKLGGRLQAESTAGTYYVDNSGSDGVGSQDDPWNNIAGHINSLSAGDTMFVRGDSTGTRTYSEAQISITVSGSSGNPITIRPYAGENVCLKSTATGTDQIRIDGSYVTIAGFEIDRDSIAKRIIYIKGNHNTIENCRLHNGEHKGIMINGGSHTTLRDCTIHDVINASPGEGHAISIYGTLTGTTISGCTIYDCNGDHIVVDDTAGNLATDTTIENCTFYVGSIAANTVENAIDVKDGTVVVRNCKMYGFREEGNAAGSAVMFHNACTTALIEDCEIYDCTSGIRAASGVNATIRRCVIRDLASVDPKAWVKTALLIQDSAHVGVYNCTFDNCPERLAYVRTSSGPAGLTFRNNICSHTGTIDERDTQGVISDHNCWYNAVDRWSGTGDVMTDPMFRNKAAGDLYLTAPSPCRNAGMDVGLVYSESAPDLGAFEYTEGEPMLRTPELKGPLDGEVVQSATVEFHWSDVGAVTYNLQVDGTVYPTGATSMTRELGGGAHSWTVQAVYASGEASAYSAPWTVAVETVPVPMPHLDSPADGTVTESASVEFRWSDVGAVAYHLRVDENVYTTNATLSTLMLSNGPHTWAVQAVDPAGNTSGYTDPWTVIVDTTLVQSWVEFVIRDETSGEETALPLKLDHAYTLRISSKS